VRVGRLERDGTNVINLRIVNVDMNGFCGRDYHPEPTMVGEVVVVERSFVDGPYDDEDVPVRVYECRRANGARVDLVEFEIEELPSVIEPGGPFVVACRVSGGVTGTRESLLKSDGRVCRYDSRAEAQAVATRLEREMNGPYARASFAYWVEAAGEVR